MFMLKQSSEFPASRTLFYFCTSRSELELLPCGVSSVTWPGALVAGKLADERDEAIISERDQ
jgi:hypothetical protein